jgi:WD40 repeat protein
VIDLTNDDLDSDLNNTVARPSDSLLVRSPLLEAANAKQTTPKPSEFTLSSRSGNFTTQSAVLSPQTQHAPIVRRDSRDAPYRSDFDLATQSLSLVEKNNHDKLERTVVQGGYSPPRTWPYHRLEEPNYEPQKRKAEEDSDLLRYIRSHGENHCSTGYNEQARIGVSDAMDGLQRTQLSLRKDKHTAPSASRPQAFAKSHLLGPESKRARNSVNLYNDTIDSETSVYMGPAQYDKAPLRSTSPHVVPPPTTALFSKTARLPAAHGRVQFDDLLKLAEAKTIDLDETESIEITSGIAQTKCLPSHGDDKAVRTQLQHKKRPGVSSSCLPSVLDPPASSRSPLLQQSSPETRTAEFSRSSSSSSVAFFTKAHPPTGVGLKPRIVPLSLVDTSRTLPNLGSPPRSSLITDTRSNASLTHLSNLTSAQQTRVKTQKIASPSTFSSAPPSLAIDKTVSVRRSHREQQSSSFKATPRFNESRMPDSKGSPFTLAEMIMVGYLQEEMGMSWSGVDVKMGRTTNSCATKYLRKPHGLKNPEVKMRFFYHDRIQALQAIILTLDPEINEAVQLLKTFIDSGKFPDEACASVFASLQTSKSNIQSVGIRHSIPSKSIRNSSPTTTLQLPLVSRDTHFKSTTLGGSDKGLRLSGRTPASEQYVRKFFETLPDENSTPSEQLSFSDSLGGSDSDDPAIIPSKTYPEGAFVRRQKPYLNYAERVHLTNILNSLDWKPGVISDLKGTSLHVNFDMEELANLYSGICTKSNRIERDVNTPLTERIVMAMRNLSDARIRSIAGRVKRSGYLEYRTFRSIEAFLRDASNALMSCNPPTALRIETNPDTPFAIPTRRQLLRRETGQRGINQKIRDTTYGTMNTTLTFTGASGDIGTLAWAPDGNLFAAGAACLVDESSMQYNRPNNLLFGNVARSALLELPHHSRLRQRTAAGVNSSQAMHASQDPVLFETVSMVDFSPDGLFMYSAGYDGYLRAYGIRRDRPELRWESDHGAKLDLLTASRYADLIAIGCQSNEDSIRVVRNESGQLLEPMVLNTQRNEKKTSPSSLRWGAHRHVQNYLLAGFSAVNEDVQYGETCLWDIERKIPITVTPSAGTIFDCNWSPTSHMFATACAAHGTNVNRGVHSFVRVYSTVDANRWFKGVELDCPARDINDVIFCPHDQNYVVAGATDGRIYVWDIRQPDSLLHKFVHGIPIMELDSTVPRELSDTGVRFCAWNHDRSRLHTGSSDGIVKVWDIFRSPKDAFVKDIGTFNSGVYSGAFNADFSSLLIGEINGSLNLLEAGKEHLKDVKSFDLETTHERQSQYSPEDASTGIQAGKALRKTKQIKFRSFGGFPMRQALQGKNYVGPYDRAPDADNLRALAAEFQSRIKVANPEDLCAIPDCRKSAIRVTAEEDGDSGRASDRIPQSLRQSNEAHSKMVTGMMKCSHCGAPARPRVNEAEQSIFPLCERCGFSCFRCSERLKVSVDAEVVHCRACGLTWNAGALGYELMHPGTTSIEPERSIEIHEDPNDLDDLGDLLHLVEEYHHSLWLDRPSSPF